MSLLRGKRKTRFGSRFSAFLGAVFLTGCGAPGYDINDPAGSAAIIDAVNIALTEEKCDVAIELIEDLYVSGYSNNQIRLLRASAHGCNTGLRFFTVVNALVSTDLTGTGFWTKMTELFPSTTDDSKSESGWYATDALQASVKTGTVIPPSIEINTGSANPGVLEPQYRIDDANAYLIFIAMSQIGTYQNRYGNPDSSYNKTNDLPWITQSTVGTEGCAYAGSVLNLLDAIDEVADASSGTVQTALQTISDTFSTNISLACELGCLGLDWDASSTVDTSCAYSAGSCTPCPTALRSRLTCVSDAKSQCAAAGIVRFINNSPTNGWPTGT